VEVITETTRRATRRWISNSDLVFDVLRICARRPHTLRELIQEPTFPGITVRLHTMRTDLSVSLCVSDGKHRGLLRRVGLTADPLRPWMHGERLRTTLLAFLLCPDLAYAEPAAYETYVKAWFDQSTARQELGTKHKTLERLFLAFPELAHRACYALSPDTPSVIAGAEPVHGDFGRYRIVDLPAAPGVGPMQAARAILSRPPLFHSDREALLSDETIPAWIKPMLRWALRRHDTAQRIEVASAPLVGPELCQGRLRPGPVFSS
jgi:hypothetical protein